MAYMKTTGGLAGYDQTPNWSWLYYPPPYAFADPAQIPAPPGFYAPAASMGLDGCHCGCGGKCGAGSGVGAAAIAGGQVQNLAGLAVVAAALGAGWWLVNSQKGRR